MAAALRTAIVGDGIIGWSIAFELARRGAAVTVHAAGAAGGATAASAGILAPYTEAHDDGPLFALALRGLEAYDGFVARLRAVSKVPFEYRRLGTLEIAEDDPRANELRARLSAVSARAAEFSWLDPEVLRARVPDVRADACGALLCPPHGHVAVSAFVAALRDATVRLGVKIASAAVRRVEPEREGIRVVTDGAPSMFDFVVLAAGAWTSSLDPFDRAAHVRPIRGQLVVLHASAVRPRHVLWGRSCYIVPWDDGTLLVGATVEDAAFDVRATAGGVRALLDAAVTLVPSLSQATFREVRVGLRPAARHGMPVLGPAPDGRIVYATGHFRNGVLLAPLTADLVANYILDGALDPAFATS